jgi:hypothetical protein
MSGHKKTRKINVTSMIVAVGVALPMGLGVSLAEEQPRPDQIIKNPARITGGLTTSPADAARTAEEAKLRLHRTPTHGYEPTREAAAALSGTLSLSLPCSAQFLEHETQS